MWDDLAFRIRLTRDRDFTLDAEGTIPMEGVTAVVGPSGSGKTTFLRVLAGLESGAAADLHFRDQVWSADGVFIPPEARRVGYVFQEPRLFRHLNVAGNIAFGARRRGDPSYDGIIDALDLGPMMERDVDSLSGGEARRVSLGRALAADPALLLLDEPMTGLDTDRRRELLPYISRAVAEARVPAIYVTHSVEEVTALADRVLGLEAGRLSGWLPAPVRLHGRVESVTDTHATLRIGDARIDIPAIAGTGETVGLAVPPESLMISATHPGGADAMAVLPAQVVRGDGEGAGLTLDVAGQRVVLPRAARHIPGVRLWLTILAGLPRPEPGDSPPSDDGGHQSDNIVNIGSGD